MSHSQSPSPASVGAGSSTVSPSTIAHYATVEDIVTSARMGEAAEVKVAIEQGVVGINTKNDKDGNSLLHTAATAGQLAVVKLLLESKANVLNKNTSGETCLHNAVQQGHFNIVAAIIQAQKKPEPLINAKNYQGNTALHFATTIGHYEMVVLLLEKGANVNAEGWRGSTPLHLAAKEGHTDIATYLIQHGAKVNAINRYRETPLHLAAIEGHADIVKLFCENNADIHATDEDQFNALHHAAREGHELVVRILLSAASQNHSSEFTEIGENIHNNNNNNEEDTPVNFLRYNVYPPIHYAKIKGHSNIEQLLVENGADANANYFKGRISSKFTDLLREQERLDKEMKATLEKIRNASRMSSSRSSPIGTASSTPVRSSPRTSPAPNPLDYLNKK